MTILMLLALWGGLAAPAAEPLPSLDELLKEYRTLGLPLPPREAKLVRYEAGGGGSVNGEVQQIVYCLAFEMKPRTKTAFPVLLNGTHEWQLEWDPHEREAKPDPAALKNLTVFSQDGLALAIQCHARGWDKLARHLLEQSQKQATIPVHNQLIQQAWGYWEGHLTTPKIDRLPIAKRLKELIRRDGTLNTEPNRALLVSLNLALVPGKGKPGTCEALIDGLVDLVGADTESIGLFEPDDPYWRIAKLGFDAVPALIEYLEDDRLTRGLSPGFFNFLPYHLRVRHVVSDLLEALAGEDLGTGWLERAGGDAVSKENAKKWWEKARKSSEEAYLLAHVFPDPKDDAHKRIAGHQLNLILAKYPKHIPTLYRTVLEKRSDLESHGLARALLLCKVASKEKLELLSLAARHRDQSHHLPALYAIKEIDKQQLKSLLLEVIDAFPRDAAGDYWMCHESYVARLAMEADDRRVLQKLAEVARRSSVGLRLELLDQFAIPRDPRLRPELLRLLGDFLDDATVRDRASSKKFEGMPAAFWEKKIEVRDFVALKLALLLGMKGKMDLGQSSEDRAATRDRVRDALRRELNR